MKLTNTLQFVTSFTVKVTQLKSWQTTNHHFNTSLSGGNNWLVSQKVKTKEVSTQPQQTSQLTCTLLANISKKEHEIYFKLLFV